MKMGPHTHLTMHLSAFSYTNILIFTHIQYTHNVVHTHRHKAQILIPNNHAHTHYKHTKS